MRQDVKLNLKCVKFEMTEASVGCYIYKSMTQKDMAIGIRI